MGSETAPRADVRLIEFADGPFRGSNVHQNVGLRVSLRAQSVVRLLPRYLQFDERLGEVADFHGELPHRMHLPTCIPDPAVLHGRVNPMPCRGALSADEQVRRRCRQAVEHGVVGGADGAAQPCLRGVAGGGLGQDAGGFDQVRRSHRPDSDIPSSLAIRQYRKPRGGRQHPPLRRLHVHPQSRYPFVPVPLFVVDTGRRSCPGTESSGTQRRGGRSRRNGPSTGEYRQPDENTGETLVTLCAGCWNGRLPRLATGPRTPLEQVIHSLGGRCQRTAGSVRPPAGGRAQT